MATVTPPIRQTSPEKETPVAIERQPSGERSAARPVSVAAGSPTAITVTQPFLPPLAEFLPYLESIWASRQLTNNGPFHAQLEAALGDFLGVRHISLVANCTIGLMLSLKAIKVGGEVITTPYSFVATAHALLWNGNRPVFVDIDPETLNLDPGKIEAAITPRTTAILPVHCYGRPCALEEIQALADFYGLKVIYDAAHAFGVHRPAGSILNHGDFSVLSFHATKVFTTFEGGAIVCPDLKTKQRVDQLKNFGLVDETTVVAPGINGKLSEIAAAFGLLQLPHMESALARRATIDSRYRQALSGTPGIACLAPPSDYTANYSYFPVLVRPEYPISRDQLYHALRDHGIYARRYFYPLITEFPMYRGMASASPANLPVANSVASQVLCLPIYPALSFEEQSRILSIVTAPGILA
jgi:dTDP-4-amino-4,6-dideoxygalactose transaminase